MSILLALLAWVLVSAGLYYLFRLTGLFVMQDQLLAKRP